MMRAAQTKKRKGIQIAMQVTNYSLSTQVLIICRMLSLIIIPMCDKPSSSITSMSCLYGAISGKNLSEMKDSSSVPMTTKAGWLIYPYALCYVYSCSGLLKVNNISDVIGFLGNGETGVTETSSHPSFP